ncbi:hypothetical protein BSL78_12854 [Apostichopus japonicus]|uniref:Endonuclease/exonuclease/phosphatase domain-containing protein n=1 Tax=Stichopus japonicus TaxID=307972 RepID=A0A2G8KQN2_STIJA|nr:hypothetical protein BSL78_12854 [Apostichopus japonicus]
MRTFRKKSRKGNEENRVVLKDGYVDRNSLRPYYLPREFSHVIVCTVYVPHRSAAKLAALELCDVIHELETASPDALFIVNGDFNHCSLRKSNVHYYQHVTCTTRATATLDLPYSNVKDAYNSIQLPALGNADHNLINLLPKYRPIVQRQKPSTVTVQQWNEDSLEHLRAELDATDWNAFIDAAGDLDELTETVSDYKIFVLNLQFQQSRLKFILTTNLGLRNGVDEDYANELNCFYNRFDRQDISAEHGDFQQQFANSDCDITVTEDEVRRHLSRLHSSKAAGPDKLSPRVLKQCAIQLSNILTYIFNQSFTTRVIPTYGTIMYHTST